MRATEATRPRKAKRRTRKSTKRKHLEVDKQNKPRTADEKKTSETGLFFGRPSGIMIGAETRRHGLPRHNTRQKEWWRKLTCCCCCCYLKLSLFPIFLLVARHKHALQLHCWVKMTQFFTAVLMVVKSWWLGYCSLLNCFSVDFRGVISSFNLLAASFRKSVERLLLAVMLERLPTL